MSEFNETVEDFNLLRAESSLTNALVANFAYSTPTATVKFPLDVKCPKMPEVNDLTVEGLALLIAKAPLDANEELDFTKVIELRNLYVNSAKIFSYVYDSEERTEEEIRLVTLSTLAFCSKHYTATRTYPNVRQTVTFFSSMAFNTSLYDYAFLVADMWITMHECGWYHQQDHTAWTNNPTGNKLCEEIKSIVLHNLDVVRQNAQISKVQGVTISMLDNCTDTTRATVATLFTSVCDLSEYTGAFFDLEFTQRYLKSRKLRLTADLSY